MILEVFVVLLGLSLVCLFIGKYLEAPPVQLGAYLFLFLLGVTLMGGGVTYKSGVSYGYTCGCCVNGSFTLGVTYNGSCSGTPSVCSTWDNLEVLCGIAGCSYNQTSLLCEGEPYDCDTWTEYRECIAQECEWSDSYTQTCENSTLITANETNVYTNYSGEVVNGVELHHIFGLFMALLSAFGFIIVLINLKSPPEGELGGGDSFREYR